jgi:hypothetical protein
MRLSILLSACALSLSTACASIPSSVAPTTSQPPVALRVENASSCEVRLRVYEAEATRATYRVPAYGTIRVTFTPLERLHAIRFVAEPVNGCGSPFTIGTLTQSPRRIAVAIGARSAESSVAEIDTAPNA